MHNHKQHAWAYWHGLSKYSQQKISEAKIAKTFEQLKSRNGSDRCGQFFFFFFLLEYCPTHGTNDSCVCTLLTMCMYIANNVYAYLGLQLTDNFSCISWTSFSELCSWKRQKRVGTRQHAAGKTIAVDHLTVTWSQKYKSRSTARLLPPPPPPPPSLSLSLSLN